jgi:hypothetical protein
MTPHVEKHFTAGDAARDIVIGMGKESMSQCPMMKRMKGMDDKSAGPHKEHPEEQK